MPMSCKGAEQDTKNHDNLVSAALISAKFLQCELLSLAWLAVPPAYNLYVKLTNLKCNKAIKHISLNIKTSKYSLWIFGSLCIEIIST